MDSRERLERWKDCFESMKEIARRQLQAAEANPFDEDAFQDLTRQWQEEQTRAEQYRHEVEKLPVNDDTLRLYRQEVRGLIESMRPLLVQSEQLIRGQYGMTGAAVKAVKDRRSLMNAYYGMDREDSVPLFFNEKK